MSWSLLPCDILLLIFDKLGFGSINYCSRVCTRWGEVSKESKSWDRVYIPKVAEIVKTVPYSEKKVILYWCDYCKKHISSNKIKFLSNKDQLMKTYHSQCPNCFELYCNNINPARCCIRCLHEIPEMPLNSIYNKPIPTSHTIKCGNNWRNCRKTITLEKDDYNKQIFSCLLERCDICKLQTPTCRNVSVRDSNLPIVTLKRVCENCIEGKLYKCLCNYGDCVCSKCGDSPYFQRHKYGQQMIATFETLKYYPVYPLCTYCVNLHNENLPLPDYVNNINVRLWTRWVFTNTRCTTKKVPALSLHLESIYPCPEDVISFLCHLYVKRYNVFGKNRKANKSFRETILDRFKEYEGSNISQTYRDDFAVLESKFKEFFNNKT